MISRCKLSSIHEKEFFLLLLIIHIWHVYHKQFHKGGIILVEKFLLKVYQSQTYWIFSLYMECISEKLHDICYPPKAIIHHPSLSHTWRRCRSRQCKIVWAWGDGSKHGNSVHAEKDILWQTPTTTPAFGSRPRGYTSRSNSSSGSSWEFIQNISDETHL